MTKPVAVFCSEVIGDPRNTVSFDENSEQPFGAISLFQPVYHPQNNNGFWAFLDNGNSKTRLTKS
jgi:hypothetical protein